MADGEVRVSLTVDTGSFEKQLRDAKKTSEAFDKEVQRVTDDLGKGFTSAAVDAATATKKLSDEQKKAVDTANKLDGAQDKVVTSSDKQAMAQKKAAEAAKRLAAEQAKASASAKTLTDSQKKSATASAATNTQRRKASASIKRQAAELAKLSKANKAVADSDDKAAVTSKKVEKATKATTAANKASLEAQQKAVATTKKLDTALNKTADSQRKTATATKTSTDATRRFVMASTKGMQAALEQAMANGRLKTSLTATAEAVKQVVASERMAVKSANEAAAAQNKTADAMRKNTDAKNKSVTASKKVTAANKKTTASSKKLKAETAKASTAFTRFSTAMRRSADSASFLTGPLGGIASRFSVLARVTSGSTAAMLGFAIAAGGVVLGLTKAISTAEKFERTGFKLDAVLKATGQSVGLTKDQIIEFTEELALNSLASVEGVQNAAIKLLQFTKIQRDDFKKTLVVAQDLAASGFGTLAGNVQLLGRALNDPAKNLTTLNRLIGLANPATKILAQNLADAGDHAGAVALVFDELARTAGAAKAEASGLAGAFDTLGQRAEKLFENIGTPFLAPFTDSVNDAAGALETLNKLLFKREETIFGSAQAEIDAFNDAASKSLGKDLGDEIGESLGDSIFDALTSSSRSLTVGPIADVFGTLIKLASSFGDAIDVTNNKDLSKLRGEIEAVNAEIAEARDLDLGGVDELIAQRDKLVAAFEDVDNIRLDKFKAELASVNEEIGKMQASATGGRSGRANKNRLAGLQKEKKVLLEVIDVINAKTAATEAEEKAADAAATAAAATLAKQEALAKRLAAEAKERKRLEELRKNTVRGIQEENAALTELLGVTGLADMTLEEFADTQERLIILAKLHSDANTELGQSDIALITLNQKLNRTIEEGNKKRREAAKATAALSAMQAENSALAELSKAFIGTTMSMAEFEAALEDSAQLLSLNVDALDKEGAALLKASADYRVLTQAIRAEQAARERTAGFEARLAALQTESTALQMNTAAIGMTDVAVRQAAVSAEAYRIEQEMLAEALSQNIVLTDAQRVAIQANAAELAEATVALEDFGAANERVTEQEAKANAQRLTFQTGLANGIANLVANTGDLEGAMKSMILQMSQAIIQAKVLEALQFSMGTSAGGGVTGGGGGGLGSILGTAIGGFFSSSPAGAGGATSAGAGGATSAAVMHTGGIVGSGGASRTVPSAVFIGAPKFHNGLKADEFPAILQKGEEVIPKDQVGKRQGGGRNVTINVTTPDADSFRASKRQLARKFKQGAAAT